MGEGPRERRTRSQAAKMVWSAINEKRGPLVLQTLYAPVQGNTRAKKWEWEWVGRGAGRGECIGNFWNSI
jgi:hypothetical protein